jgi:hypothetical protein
LPAKGEVEEASHLIYNQFAKLFSAKLVIYNAYKNAKRVKPSLHIDVRAALIPDFGLRGLTPRDRLIQFFL